MKCKFNAYIDKRKEENVFLCIQQPLILLRKRSVWFNWLNLLQTLCSCVYWPHRTKGSFIWSLAGELMEQLSDLCAQTVMTSASAEQNRTGSPLALNAHGLWLISPGLWTALTLTSLFISLCSLSLCFSELNRVCWALCFLTYLLLLSVYH